MKGSFGKAAWAATSALVLVTVVLKRLCLPKATLHKGFPSGKGWKFWLYPPSPDTFIHRSLNPRRSPRGLHLSVSIMSNTFSAGWRMSLWELNRPTMTVLPQKHVISHHVFKSSAKDPTFAEMSRAVLTPKWVIPPPLPWLWPLWSFITRWNVEAADVNWADRNLVCRFCWSSCAGTRYSFQTRPDTYLQAGILSSAHLPLFHVSPQWQEFLWSRRYCKAFGPKCRENHF